MVWMVKKLKNRVVSLVTLGGGCEFTLDLAQAAVKKVGGRLGGLSVLWRGVSLCGQPCIKSLAPATKAR